MAGVDVILPALDEAAALEWVLPRMPTSYRAIVVDNGSTDGTAEVAFVIRDETQGLGLG